MVNLMKLKRFDPLKFARTDKPEGTPKIKVPPHLARTKGEQERQRAVAKFNRKEAKSCRRPTERGETIPRGRQHHCAICKKAMSAICLRKGHMVECSKCSENYKMVGRYCAGCKAADDAKARKKGEEVAAEKKRSKMEDKDKWYREI
ncbi:MAG: hypothetical protein LQ345_004908 [Seirophora villosa]|nr:MAG: hypothetical protein LQ345_004908 [Seirophora villosa]